MARSLGVICWLAVALICATGSTAASSSFEQQLTQADRLRRIDGQRFLQLLGELDAREDATASQLLRLRYLHAYQSVVYRNAPRQGIEQAKVLFNEATDPDLKFRAGSLLVTGYAITRDFTEGLRYLNQTLPMRNMVQDKDIRHDGIDSAAMLYNQLGQYALAKHYAEETLSDQPNPKTKCAAGLMLLEANFHLGALPNGDSAIRNDIQGCLAIGDKMAANFARVLLARKWSAEGEGGKAIELLDRHLAEVEGIGYDYLVAEVRALLADLRLGMDELAAAQRHAETVIARAGSLPSPKFLATAYNVLYQIAERQQQPVAALGFYRRYSEADRAHLTDVSARELAYQIVREETLQKSQQIERLHSENRLLQLQQRVDKQATQNTQLLVAMLTLLVALIGVWAYKVKRVQMSLRRMAQTDALTGINNRHHFTRQAERGLVESAQAGEPCALIMFDLDHFKAINDSYGHATGDWVLQQVANSCQPHCRQMDHQGRLGGEEFAIFLQGIDLRAATRLAEDCRVRLTQIDTRDSGYTFVITASFGVSATPACGYDLTKLLSNADRMMYSAKRAGRNRVHTFTGELSGHSQLQVVTRTDASPAGESSPAQQNDHRAG